MPTSDTRLPPGAVVRVPFPYTGADSLQHRPALVVATGGPETGPDTPLLLWVLMITSAENRGWQGDVNIPGAPATGLPIPSVVRTAKIATIDAARAQPRGRVATETLAEVRAELSRRLCL